MENNNKNNRIKAAILFVLTIITVACIIVGTTRFTGNVKSNIKNSLKEHGITINGFDWDWDYDDEYDGEDGADGKNGKDGNTSVSGAKSVSSNLDAFTNLKIDAKVMSVTIKNGDKYSYSCKYNKEKLKPEVRNRNGTLEIIQHGLKNNNSSIKCNLEITLPRYSKLDDVDIKINVGEINIENFDCINCDLLNDVGEIDVLNVNFESLDIENNVGEINIKMLSSIDDYDINLNTNIGEINVDGNNYRHNFSQRNSSSKRIRANTNIGEINLR